MGRAYTWHVGVCGGFWGAGRVRRVGVKTIRKSEERCFRGRGTSNSREIIRRAGFESQRKR